MTREILPTIREYIDTTTNPERIEELKKQFQTWSKDKLAELQNAISETLKSQPAQDAQAKLTALRGRVEAWSKDNNLSNLEKTGSDIGGAAGAYAQETLEAGQSIVRNEWKKFTDDKTPLDSKILRGMGITLGAVLLYKGCKWLLKREEGDSRLWQAAKFLGVSWLTTFVVRKLGPMAEDQISKREKENKIIEEKLKTHDGDWLSTEQTITLDGQPSKMQVLPDGLKIDGKSYKISIDTSNPFTKTFLGFCKEDVINPTISKAVCVKGSLQVSSSVNYTGRKVIFTFPPTFEEVPKSYSVSDYAIKKTDLITLLTQAKAGTTPIKIGPVVFDQK